MTAKQDNPLPEFPREFVKDHCPRVLEARRWRRDLGAEGTDEDDEAYAECAFIPQGVGMGCEECDLFLYEGEHLAAIRKYYEDVKAWDEGQKLEIETVVLGVTMIVNGISVSGLCPECRWKSEVTVEIPVPHEVTFQCPSHGDWTAVLDWDKIRWDGINLRSANDVPPSEGRETT